MSAPLRPPSGHVFRVDRSRGPVWYAKYRLSDGRQAVPLMPRISAFHGITILMYWDEGVHSVPHFHARSGTAKASIGLDGSVIAGSLPATRLRLVREWTALHRDELSADWGRPRRGVLTGMGHIPIERGSGDSGALDRVIEELRKGACLGIYPEGTRSLGRMLRARSGIGYIARAVPEARIIGVACNGTVAIPRFPRARPDVRVEFFEFDRPAIAPEESPQQYSTRLLAQLRQRAPIEVAGRERAAALAGRVPTWSSELAITGKPGGKGALEEALAQSAANHA